MIILYIMIPHCLPTFTKTIEKEGSNQSEKVNTQEEEFLQKQTCFPQPPLQDTSTALENIRLDKKQTFDKNEVKLIDKVKQPQNNFFRKIIFSFLTL